jgi:potassium intermediate/small conductance calcium-activated channel subfamily N
MMVVENELSAAKIYEKSSLTSIFLKSMILLSTMILLALVVKFHIHEVQLFMNANSAEDWRIALTFRRCSQIGIELLANGICPIPLDINFSWTTVHPDSVMPTTNSVPLDVILSIPMFFRLYWLCRVMLLHSRLFTDASSRSIAGLNRVNFNARFILKTLMTLCPGTMLLVFTASLWVIAGWILRLCERYHLSDQPTIHSR